MVAGPLTVRRSSWRRRLGVVAVVLAVAAVHGCVARRFAAHMAAVTGSFDAPPARLTAIYVRSMAPEDLAEPGAAGAARQAVVPKLRPQPADTMVQVAAAASATAAEPVASAAAAEPASAPASAVAGEATAASEPEPEPVRAASAASTATTGRPGFTWPAATRLSFKLTGYYRGDVYGSAQVEWLRADDRYQVHLDVRVGFDSAPFLTRRMSSEGRITPEGLAPARYDQETRLAFSEPSRATVKIEPGAVWLANGQRREPLPGLQDTASQFVQLAWLFSTRPGMAAPGGTVELPLALPRSVDRVLYDVHPPERLQTPFGEVPVLRLSPRRVAKAGGDMTVEMWIAPRYRHLPIRLKIHQDAETYVDLMITRPPELAADP